MKEGLRPGLIREHGRQLARLEIGVERAAELAAEVGRLNDAVLGGAARLDFNDEPARFAALLESYRKKARR
ncbi:MAG: hypothetical protein IT529_01720 [Burkholderiales bacterium]|nr:hypothetical protein [Burkholderiales bacterium]